MGARIEVTEYLSVIALRALPSRRDY
jgi:hypothetical protein